MTFIKNYLHWLGSMDTNLTMNEKYMMLTLVILIFFVAMFLGSDKNN